MKLLLKRCVIVLLIAFLLPGKCFAIPSDLWSDDGTLNKIYGAGSGSENAAMQTSDILSELLYELSILPSATYEFNKNADFATFLQGVSSIAGLPEGDGVFERLQDAGLVASEQYAKYVSFDEAVYSAVVLTGYRQQAEVNGGVPYGYYMTAHQNGLLYNISYRAGEYITYGELVQMFYNTISISANVTTSISWQGKKMEKGDSLLESRFDVELKRGILTGAYDTNLYPAQTLSERQAAIDQIIYEANGAELAKYVGMTMNAFVKDDDGTARILIAQPDMSQCKVITFRAQEAWGLDGTRVKISREDGTEKINIAQNARVVYNGIYAGNLTESALKDYLSGEAQITVIDSNRDGIYEVLTIWEYEHFISKFDVGVTARMQFQYDLDYRGSRSVVLDEEDTVTEIYVLGAPASPEDIKKGMVVSLAGSVNSVGKKHLRVEASNRKVNGKVSKIGYRNNIFTAVVGETEYELTKQYSQIGGDPSKPALHTDVVAIEPGFLYECNLTFDGKIADAVSNSSAERFGCMIAYAVQTIIDTEVTLKIFTEDGKVELFPLANDVIVHDLLAPQGVEMKKESVPSHLAGQAVDDPRMMVKFRTNGSGAIAELYLPIDNMDNGPGTMDYPLSIDFSKAGNVRYYQGMLDMSYRTLPEMKLFMIPSAEKRNDEKEYRVTSADSYGVDHYYSDMTLYGVDSFYIPRVAVTQASAAQFGNTAAVIVDSVGKGLDGDGNDVCVVHYFKDGSLSEAITEESELVSLPQDGWYDKVNISDLKRGDIIHYEANSRGAIARFRVLYRTEEPGEYRMKDDTGTTLTSLKEPYGFGMQYGKVVGVKEDVLMMDFENDQISRQPTRLMSYTNYYLVENDKIIKVSDSELEPGDIAVVRFGWQGALEVFLYR